MLKSLHLDVVLTSFQTSLHKQLSRPSRPDTAWVLPCWMFQRADPEGKERETCWWPWRSRHKEILVCSDFGQKEMYKGYRFLGGAISVYSVSCMSNVIFNPSLLNWSSLILTVAHMFPGSRCMLWHTQPAEICCGLPSSKDLRFCLEAMSSATFKFLEPWHRISEPHLWHASERNGSDSLALVTVS